MTSIPETFVLKRRLISKHAVEGEVTSSHGRAATDQLKVAVHSFAANISDSMRF